jgi:hypothetical protein
VIVPFHIAAASYNSQIKVEGTAKTVPALLFKGWFVLALFWICLASDVSLNSCEIYETHLSSKGIQ